MLGAAWVYLILGAKEQVNKQANDAIANMAHSNNNVTGISNGTEYWDYGHMNNNGNTVEDRVSASSGIASANSSSMPWGLPEVGSNIASSQTFGPQVNVYNPQSTSPIGRHLQEGCLEQELRTLTFRNNPVFSSTIPCKCISDGALQTAKTFSYNASSIATCELHGHSTNNHPLARSNIHALSSTPSPHLTGLPQVFRNDNLTRARQFSPSCSKSIAQSSPTCYMTNGDTSQSSTVGSVLPQQNNDSVMINGIANNRVNECLTETTDCPSEISVLTATTNTTAGPLISSRRESTRKSKKSIATSDRETISTIMKNDVFPSSQVTSSMSTSCHSSKTNKYSSNQTGKN